MAKNAPKGTDTQYPCNLRVYRFEGNKAHLHLALEFKEGVSLESMLKLLTTLRTGLPRGYGAALTDARGRNIRPSTED
jgi:hypothetical protein